jgi:hypothetical protein
MILAFIQAVPESNFGLVTDHPEKFFVVSLEPLVKFQDSTSSLAVTASFHMAYFPFHYSAPIQQFDILQCEVLT